MKASTREWVLKAEEDFLAASALNLRRKKPLWNVVSFHVQQTVEKYLTEMTKKAASHSFFHFPLVHFPILICSDESPRTDRRYRHGQIHLCSTASRPRHSGGRYR